MADFLMSATFPLQVLRLFTDALLVRPALGLVRGGPRSTAHGWNRVFAYFLASHLAPALIGAVAAAFLGFDPRIVAIAAMAVVGLSLSPFLLMPDLFQRNSCILKTPSGRRIVFTSWHDWYDLELAWHKIEVMEQNEAPVARFEFLYSREYAAGFLVGRVDDDCLEILVPPGRSSRRDRTSSWDLEVLELEFASGEVRRSRAPLPRTADAKAPIEAWERLYYASDFVDTTRDSTGRPTNSLGRWHEADADAG